MNDVYVGFFIVAAYTLFAALWMGHLKRRWAFWLAMPTIGVLLGLALASKWVGLYALAGIGDPDPRALRAGTARDHPRR